MLWTLHNGGNAKTCPEAAGTAARNKILNTNEMFAQLVSQRALKCAEARSVLGRLLRQERVRSHLRGLV